MWRTTLDKAHDKRTIRPLYAFTQSTPKVGTLDPNWDKSVDIFPGMVMMKTQGDHYSLIDGTGVPAGLSALWIAPVYGVDELIETGIDQLAVWVLGPDSEFEVLAPAFDDSLTFTDPADGTDLLIHASTAGANRGKLVPAGSPNASASPVARLIRVVSAKKIIVGGLLPR